MSPFVTPLPRHATGLRSHRLRRAAGLVATGALCLTGAGATAAYLDLRSAIEVSDADALLGDRTGRPERTADPDDPFAGQDRNILVMGTDYRGGGNAALAGQGEEFHSDSTLIVHVAGDRSRIEVVSIPRDSLLDIPACPLPGGGESLPRSAAMFNEAFTIGGGPGQDFAGAAACTILTVEALTGVPVTDHVVVKMEGVIPLVDALGGVTMCLPEPVEGSKDVDLHLPAGEQTLDGYQAINFLRARKGTGMGLEVGSDLGRIQRQQAFLDSMVREVLRQNVITDSPRLYRLVEAALRSISTSRELASPQALAGLAWSLRDVDPANVVFTPLPVVDSPTQPGRVEWVASQTDPIWERIIADRAPGATGPGTSDAPAADGAATPPPPGDGGGSPTPSDTATGTAGEPATDPVQQPPAPVPTPSLLPGVCPS